MDSKQKAEKRLYSDEEIVELYWQRNGGTPEYDVPTSFTVLDLPITLPSTEKADSYFIGWYTDSGYTDSTTQITECEDIELYLGFTVETLSGMEFTELDGGSYAISAYTGNESQVLIPYLYNGKPVTEISANAFEGNSIRKITLSERITKIGESAFSNCTSLTEVKFSTGVGIPNLHPLKNNRVL